MLIPTTAGPMLIGGTSDWSFVSKRKIYIYLFIFVLETFSSFRTIYNRSVSTAAASFTITSKYQQPTRDYT